MRKRLDRSVREREREREIEIRKDVKIGKGHSFLQNAKVKSSTPSSSTPLHTELIISLRRPLKHSPLSLMPTAIDCFKSIKQLFTITILI